MPAIEGKSVTKVVVACDAGMGSSVMLAGQMRKRLKKYDVAVEHVPVNAIPSDAQVVLCHVGLADRAQRIAPDAAVVPFQVFLGDAAFDRVEAAIRDGGSLGG
jgi:mannitol-specific phosphotransferase system IIBC component